MAVESPPPPTLLDLPPNAVDEILIRLPIRDAVLTGALSRPWRHRWKSIPDLQFLDRALPAAAIDTVLSLHSAPIHRFSLITDHSDHIDRWLISLSRRGGAHSLHSLHLSFIQLSPPYPLPPSAFSFHKTLTHLALSNCSIDPPTSDFPSLLKLSLTQVDFPDDDNPGQHLPLLLSRCPALEELELVSVRPRGRLRIHNRNLRCFQFRGDCDVITLTGGMTLRILSISIYGGGANMSLANLFGDAVCNGTLSLLTSPLIEALAKGNIPESIPTGFQQLKTLNMRVNLMDARQRALMLCLLMSAPNLQELLLSTRSNKGRSDNESDSWAAEEFWKLQHSLDLLANLRTVTVFANMFTQLEMEFMRLILARAKVLERLMIINCDKDEATMARYELAFKELRNSYKASDQAKILRTRRRMDMNTLTQ